MINALLAAILLIISTASSTPLDPRIVACGCTTECNLQNVSDTTCEPYASIYNETTQIDSSVWDWGGRFLNSATVPPFRITFPTAAPTPPVNCGSGGEFTAYFTNGTTQTVVSGLTQLDAKNCLVNWTQTTVPNYLILKLRDVFTTNGARPFTISQQKRTAIHDFWFTQGSAGLYTFVLAGETCTISESEWPETITVTNSTCGGSYVATSTGDAGYTFEVTSNCSATASFAITATSFEAAIQLPPTTGPARIYVPPGYDLAMLLGITVGAAFIVAVIAILILRERSGNSFFSWAKGVTERRKRRPVTDRNAQGILAAPGSSFSRHPTLLRQSNSLNLKRRGGSSRNGDLV